MSKHTPGPWELIEGNRIYSALGADSGDGVPADSTDGWHIASIGETPTFVDGVEVELGRDVRLANARLAVAAPDLLEALEEAMSMLGSRLIKDTFGYEWHEKARDAIARARGEA